MITNLDSFYRDQFNTTIRFKVKIDLEVCPKNAYPRPINHNQQNANK